MPVLSNRTITPLNLLLCASLALSTLACKEDTASNPAPSDTTPTSNTEAEAAINAAKKLAEEQHGHGQLPEGHPPTGQLPAGHPPVDQQPTGQGSGAEAKPAANAAGGLQWEVAAPLVAVPPASSMRAAEYKVEGNDSADAAVLTVFYFGTGQGGSVDANLERWIGQFQQPDGADNRTAAKLDDQEIAGMAVKRLDLRGTFMGGMGPMQGSGGPQPDHRVLGAIVSGPKGPVFFKLLGPAATVDKAQGAFDALISSIKAAS